MAELSRAEAYIAGPKGREYAAVALDRADSSAEPLAWEVGGRSPACHPSHVAANAGFGAEPQEVRGAHFNSAYSARRNRRLSHGILKVDASIQFNSISRFLKSVVNTAGLRPTLLPMGTVLNHPSAL